MFRRVKKGLLIIFTGMLLMSAPVMASAGEMPETAEAMETDTETEAYTGREIIKASPLPAFEGSVQVLYGVPFEDGSFDMWAISAGVMVNSSTVLCTDISDADFTETVRDREPGYATLGLYPQDASLCFMVYNEKDLTAVTDVLYESVELEKEDREDEEKEDKENKEMVLKKYLKILLIFHQWHQIYRLSSIVYYIKHI